MQVQSAEARLAPRSPWQAMDLGLRLFQRWWRPLVTLWLSFTLPAVALLAVVFVWSPLAALLLFWWCKPVWERPLLVYVARRLFQSDTSVRQVARDSLRTLHRQTLPFLFWRRLDPLRGFHMPVALLEGQKGASYRARCRALASGPANQAGACTLLSLVLEQGLGYSLMILGFMLLPNQVGIENIEWFYEADDSYLLAGTLVWYLAMTICEPLYVCMSFALYINKRTWLEGWDLESGLRRIGEKRAALVPTTALSLLLALGTMALLPIPGPVQAAVPETRVFEQGADNPDEAREAAARILAGEQFMPMSEEGGRRWRDFGKDRAENSEPGWFSQQWERFNEWLKALFTSDDPADTTDSSNFWLDLLELVPTLADLVRVLLWSVVISLVLWTIWRYRHWIARIASPEHKAARKLATLAGLDIRRSTLPDDIEAHCLAALDDGQTREALSLLYRATLSRLVESLDVPLQPGATETECLALFRQHHRDKPGVALLAKLTPLWISTAWAHRPATPDTITPLVFEWRSAFASAEVANA